MAKVKMDDQQSKPSRREAIASLFALPVTTTITRTQIQPNDLFVFSAPGSISQEQADRIKTTVEEIFKDLNVRVMVLGDGLTLSIVREGNQAHGK
jgi:hypothetical protein